MMKRFAFFVALLCSLTGIVRAQNKEEEADLKAAFIYNFTKYIDWDSSGANNNFVIGIIGASPVSGPLREIASGKTVGGKRIIIRNFSSPDEITDCDVLFIPQDLPYPLETILDKTSKGTLTISEEDGYAKKGTALNFVIRNDKLRFEANLRAMLSAGLKASSQLLKLAIIVD